MGLEVQRDADRARLGSSGGSEPSSNSVTSPSASMRPSCCHAVFVPGPILNELFRPPRRQRICPLPRCSWYAAQVLRAEISTLPSGWGSIELMWNQSHGRDEGGEVCGLVDVDVVEAVPLPAHEPGLHVDLLTAASRMDTVARALGRAQVAADRVERRDVGDVVRRNLEVVQVGLQTVAALDGRDGLVVGVDDDILALAEAERSARCPARRSGRAGRRSVWTLRSSAMRLPDSWWNQTSRP